MELGRSSFEKEQEGGEKGNVIVASAEVVSMEDGPTQNLNEKWTLGSVGKEWKEGEVGGEVGVRMEEKEWYHYVYGRGTPCIA